MPVPYHDASALLASLDEDWRRHVETIGPCLLQPKPARDPYEALVRAIAYQQLHAKAGDAILGRLLALFTPGSFPRPEQILATDVAQLRSCGFSASKIATIQGIAQATLDAIVPDYTTARAMEDEALIERLISLRGVGRWTVEMLLIYSWSDQTSCRPMTLAYAKAIDGSRAWRNSLAASRWWRSAWPGALIGRWRRGICGGCPAARPCHRSSRASSLPQLIFSVHKLYLHRKSPVGASLLAKAVAWSPSIQLSRHKLSRLY